MAKKNDQARLMAVLAGTLALLMPLAALSAS